MPNSTTPKLSDTQLVILSSASQREDGLAVLPERIKGAAAKTAVTKLIGLGLLKEVRAKRDQPAWRTDEEDRPVALKLTRAGSEAIGVDPDAATEESPAASANGKNRSGPATPVGADPRPGSKQALVISLLERSTGATLDDLIKATGWLPHTTRAALTGLRHKGHAIEKAKSDAGKTVYQLPNNGSAKSSSARASARG
jgi:hypothetical protein